MKLMHKKLNKIVCSGNYCKIFLTRNGEFDAVALIDKDDKEKISYYRWTIKYEGSNSRYKTTVASVNGKMKRLHHLIFGKRTGYEVDHINRNSLDNRKSNLRYATRQQNSFNNNAKGIHWSKTDKRWVANIAPNGKTVYLGGFINKIDAIEARIKAEKKYFGSYAPNRKQKVLASPVIS